MCGIFASLGFPPDRSRIDVVAHRGPDGDGWQVFETEAGPLALGHRRLAIIDPRLCGLQPMADAAGRRHLVFNGEIYNYVELRRELESAGHVFATGTDSEVLLAAYREWGEACLERFLGMFAFVIYDEDKQRLFAARDRFGIKPLYCAATRNGIAFGSEIKQLLGLPGLPGGIDLLRVRDFLAEGIADHSAATMFAGIGQIRPGECVMVETGRPWTGECAPRRWYAVPPHGTLSLSVGDAAERFRELLTEAVRLHLRSDVPLGSCLSGGLDSSAIVCLASRLLGGAARMTTVSATWPGEMVDERRYVEAVVGATGAEPRYVAPRSDDILARAAEITWHQDEPFGSTSILAQDAVFAEARRAGLKVMLDGQGADEQLAGYHGGYAFHLVGLLRRAQVGELLRTVAERREQHGASYGGQAARFTAALLPPALDAAGRRWRRGAAARTWLDGPALRDAGAPPGGLALASAVAGLPAATDLASLCVVLTFSANLQMLLHWEDRSSMAHGIEARVPFLDHRLVEFCLALGNDHKIEGATTKAVMRRALADVLPPPVLARRDKIGFATPETSWFRGPLREAMREGVEAALARFPGLFQAPAARQLAADMLDGRRTVDFALWRIVNLGIWGERFGLSH